MPLCPTCIREHTHYHQDLKTKPLYFSIQETVNEVRELVYAAITQLEQDNARRVRTASHRRRSRSASPAGTYSWLPPSPRPARPCTRGSRRSSRRCRPTSISTSSRSTRSWASSHSPRPRRWRTSSARPPPSSMTSTTPSRLTNSSAASSSSSRRRRRARRRYTPSSPPSSRSPSPHSG